MFVLQRHSTPLLYYLPCRMANHVDQPVFQIRLVEPHSPWLSDRVENSLTDHFNFNQYITDQQPLFHDLILDMISTHLILSKALCQNKILTPILILLCMKTHLLQMTLAKLLSKSSITTVLEKTVRWCLVWDPSNNPSGGNKQK